MALRSLLFLCSKSAKRAVEKGEVQSYDFGCVYNPTHKHFKQPAKGALHWPHSLGLEAQNSARTRNFSASRASRVRLKQP
jgi:hypothetical protein